MKSWISIVHTLVSQDMEKINEIASRVSSSSLSSYFSLQNEYQERAEGFKKLSFCIFAAPTDFYIVKLPNIQEKIAEALKSSSAILKAEVLFCLQILMLKISPKSFSPFWLNISYELLKVFTENIRSLSKSKEDLNLLLEACRILYLANHLQIDEFQTQKWIFLPDLVSELEHLIEPSEKIAIEGSLFFSLKSIHTPAELLSFFSCLRNSRNAKLDLEAFYLRYFEFAISPNEQQL